MSTINLDDALARGLINTSDYERLQQAVITPATGEPVRIVNRFSEVFISIGLIMSYWGLIMVSWSGKTTSPIVPIGWVIAAWIAAEGLYRFKAMRLPTIVALLLAAGTAAFAAWGGGNVFAQTKPNLFYSTATVSACWALGILALGFARFRIPFLLAPIGLAIGTIATLVQGRTGDALLATVGVCGLGLFIAAVLCDRRDPKRTGIASQHAFWLYLVGSPMLLHPLFLTLFVINKPIGSASLWLSLVVSAALVTIAGLTLNRRAPVNSTFIYIGIAAAMISHSAGLTTLLIGLYVLALGLLWDRIRAVVLKSEILRAIDPSHGTLKA